MVTQVSNFMSPLDFMFKLQRAPELSYNVQDANIPDLTGNVIEYPTPFRPIPIAGDTLSYGDFMMTFRVDENMSNYLEIFNWMIGIYFPNTFEEHQTVANATPSSGAGIYSDGTLTILNSTKNPNIEIRYQDLFPIGLTDVQLSTKEETITYVEATATFRYKQFTIGVI